jgi:hypothetical protein
MMIVQLTAQRQEHTKVGADRTQDAKFEVKKIL